MQAKNAEMLWLSEGMKVKIKKVFEPRYKRKLTDNEVFEIAENLSGVVETLIKWKWKEQYANK